MTFSILDVVFILIILIFSIIAATKGFIKELFNKAALIIGILMGCLFAKKLAPYISFVKSNGLKLIIAFLLIFMVIFLIIHIVKTFIGHAFEGEIMKGMDKSLGFFLGFLEGIIIVMLIIILIKSQPFFATEDLFNDSFFYKILSPLLFKNQKPIIKKDIA